MENKILIYLKNIYASLKDLKKILKTNDFEEGLETLKEIKSSSLWEQESYTTFNCGASENDITANYVFYNKFLDVDVNIFVNNSARYISATRTSILFARDDTKMKR